MANAMKPKTFLLSLGLCVGLSCHTGLLWGQTTKPTPQATAQSYAVPPADPQTTALCAPGSGNTAGAPSCPDRPSDTPQAPNQNSSEQAPFSILLTRVFAFLAALGIAGFLLVQWTRRQGGFNPQKGATGLCVLETRMLGNKQYLMVARYGEAVFLLGVGPGYITHLRNLSDTTPPAASHPKPLCGAPPS
jgi:flagellar protein FliO/FliZ